jgi:hypothetical protein
LRSRYSIDNLDSVLNPDVRRPDSLFDCRFNVMRAVAADSVDGREPDMLFSPRSRVLKSRNAKKQTP